MSYYVSDTAHLYMMHDTAESVDYELLHRGTWMKKKREPDFLKEEDRKGRKYIHCDVYMTRTTCSSCVHGSSCQHKYRGRKQGREGGKREGER